MYRVEDLKRRLWSKQFEKMIALRYLLFLLFFIHFGSREPCAASRQEKAVFASSAALMAIEAYQHGAEAYPGRSHAVYCVAQPSESVSPYLFWMPPDLSYGLSFKSDDDTALHAFPSLYSALRDEALRTGGGFDMRCVFPPQSEAAMEETRARGHLTVLVGPPRPNVHSPLADPTVHYFRNFTYSYKILHPKEEEDHRFVEQQHGGPQGTLIRVVLFSRNQTRRRWSALPTFDRVATAALDTAEGEVTPPAVAVEEGKFGIPTHLPSSRGMHVYEPHPPYSDSAFPALWARATGFVVERLQRVARYSWMRGGPGCVLNLLRQRRLTVEFTVGERKLEKEQEATGARVFRASRLPDDSEEEEPYRPTSREMLREGKENVLHVVSYPPVAVRQVSSKGKGEEFVCDYAAVKDAQHHYLYDPIVFVNQRSQWKDTEEDAKKTESFLRSQRHSVSPSPRDDPGSNNDIFFSELLELENEGENSADSEEILESSGFLPLSSSPTPALLRAVLQLPRLFSLLLWGLQSAPEGLDSSSGGISSDTSRGGFSLSASQLAAGRFTQKVMAEMGPSSTAQERRRRQRQVLGGVSASLFTSTRHEMLAHVVDGPHTATRYLYRWEATVPASRAVCVSVAPTWRAQRGGPVHIEVKERLALDWGALVPILAFFLVGFLQDALFVWNSKVLRTLVTGGCGVFVLIIVAALYIARKIPKMKLGRTSVYVLLAVGGVATVAEFLLDIGRQCVGALDKTYGRVEWRVYVIVCLFGIGLLCSFVVRHVVPVTVQNSLTRHSLYLVRLCLALSAAVRHAEALLFCVGLYGVVRGCVELFLFILWIRYEPSIEEERRRGLDATADGGQRSRPPRRSLLSTLQHRVACRQYTKKHYTLYRVAFRCLRRLSRRLFLQLQASVEDLASEDEGESGRSSEEVGRSSVRSSTVLPRDSAGSEVPEARRSSSQTTQRRSSGLLQQLLYYPVKKTAIAMERRKHPRRYGSCALDGMHSSGVPSTPLSSMLRRSQQIRLPGGSRQSVPPPLLHRRQDDDESSDSSDEETGEGGMPFDVFRRQPSSAAEKFFRSHINDPLEVFPRHVYQEAAYNPLARGESGRRERMSARDFEAQGSEYTRIQLHALARRIRTHTNPSQIISRLENPKNVFKWAENYEVSSDSHESD